MALSSHQTKAHRGHIGWGAWLVSHQAGESNGVGPSVHPPDTSYRQAPYFKKVIEKNQNPEFNLRQNFYLNL